MVPTQRKHGTVVGKKVGMRYVCVRVCERCMIINRDTKCHSCQPLLVKSDLFTCAELALWQGG
jgi:hypothetical protein